MEAPARILHRHKTKRSRRSLFIIAIIVIVVILAIVIPLAVVLPRKNRSHGETSTVIVPLYIYPDVGAWDPLYEG
jgi:flagellar basal body-associated protein FliL